MEQQPRAITVEFDVPATMRDGTVLRANVYRPTGEGTWPALLTRLPYGKDFPLGTIVIDPVQAARRGYVVIVQDTRGRSRSEGDWYPLRPEAQDGADTLAWAAALPQVDGQVGMYRCSYFGFSQWSAATQQPAALKALVPFVTWSDPVNGLSFRGGAFELGILASWNLQMGLDVLIRRHSRDPQALGQAIAALCREVDALGSAGYRSLPLSEFAPLRRRDIAAAFFFDEVAAPLDRDRTEPWTIRGKHERVQVPTFNVGGWYDIFLADTIANFQAMRAQDKPTKLLVGPWPHSASGGDPHIGEVNFGIGAQLSFIDCQMDFGSLQLRWFDHWLKGIDTGMLAEPPIKLFVMGANVWREESEWPLARAVNTPFYLRAEGQLSRELPNAEEPGRYDYDPANPVPTRGGAVLMTPDYPGGPFDQRPIEARADVLVFRTAPLERDLEVTGPLQVQLWAISSAPDTDFVARLVDVYPDGRSINLTDGIIRARYRDAGRDEPPTLIEPGHPYEYEIDLWATNNVFKAGHRIGLQVTSSCFPRWDRNPNTGHTFGADAELQVAHQEILHDREHPSYVVLPLLPP